MAQPRIRVGLLPLYIALYDEAVPHLRGELEPMIDQLTGALRGFGLAVEAAPICCVQEQVEAAVGDLEQGGVDVLATLHLAYSPSLESARVLAGCPLPLVVVDTTMDASFGLDTHPLRLLYNHGIHGVQDLCSVLRRMGRDYRVVAGHIGDVDFHARLVGAIGAAKVATTWRGMRVLRIGEPFAGMGDFQAPAETLRRLSLEVDALSAHDLRASMDGVDEQAVEAEREADMQRYQVDAPADVHRRSLRMGLALRDALERGAFGALSMNFKAFEFPGDDEATVPFLECCKAMARGLGYAGEGDVLTASLVGALQAGLGPTSFVEMFCPDWRGGLLFISHMGEFNPAIASARPRLYEKDYAFTQAANPVTLACAPAPGPATLVNVSPGPDDSLRLITAKVEVQGDGTHPSLNEWIRGWLRPSMALPAFLERYSQLGGTHHGALLPGDHVQGLAWTARLLGMEYAIVE